MRDTERPYRPVDPGAYGGRLELRRADVVRAAAVQAGLLLVLLAWHGALALVIVAALTLINARVAAWPLTRRGDAPFVVDRPGVFVADVAGAGGRVVHWESISAIVLAEMTSRRSGHRRRVPGVGLRLRSHPEVVAIRRPLDDWVLDRRSLESAVARFAPTGVVVVADGPLGEGFTPRAVAEDYARRAVRRAGRAALRVVEKRTGRPIGRPAGARTPTPPVVVQVAEEPGATPILGRPSAAGYVARDAAGSVRLAVDAAGVRLGEGRGGEGDRVVAWPDVAAVVVFDVEDRHGWYPAVGVAPRHAPAAPEVRHLAGYRVAHGWSLDRGALETAVRLHAPRVPVVDGGPARRARAADAAAALVAVYRRQAARRAHRGPSEPVFSGRQGVRVTRTDLSRSGSAFTSSDRGSPTSR